MQDRPEGYQDVPLSEAEFRDLKRRVEQGLIEIAQQQINPPNSSPPETKAHTSKLDDK